MTEKTGRNDPCPCGSGKKYKQCCLKNKLPSGRKKFKASVISSGKKAPDLMERTFGNAIRAGIKDEKPPLATNENQSESEDTSEKT